MEKAHIVKIREDGREERSPLLERLFIEEVNHITRKQIRDAAKGIARDLKDFEKRLKREPGEDGRRLDERKAIFILDMLRPENIFVNIRSPQSSTQVKFVRGSRHEFMLEAADENGNIMTESIEAYEMDQYLKSIRLALLEELRNLGVPYVEIIQNVIYRGSHSSVSRLSEGRVYKENYVSRFGSGWEEILLKAFIRLQGIAERSPYIGYQVLYVDPYKMDSVQKELNIDMLWERIRGRGISLTDALRYCADAMRGSMFLLKHGLVLTDNRVANIGIDTDNDTGILFDFDGLRCDESDFAYIGAPYVIPPEASSSRSSVVGEKQIVYEFGRSIGHIIDELSPVVPDGLVIIINRMISSDPNIRPTLQKAVDMVDRVRDALASQGQHT